jgi:phage/plasmid-like protein (TIGR03299 family)
MAHGIMANDGMFSGNGIRPWHGLGTVIDGTATSDEAIKLANLGWDVIQEPVFLQDGTQIDNLFANVRSDTKEVLGTVKNKYRISQNVETFAFMDAIIQNSKGIECRYETAGSLFNGRKVFMLVRLPETDILGDEIENYLFLSNSHDGTSGLTCGITNIRVCCNNTLQMAEKGAQRIWKIRHCASLKDKIIEAEESLGLALTYQERVAEDAEKMARKKIDEKKFFEVFFKKLDLAEKNREKVMNNILELYTGKNDLQNFRGSAWGMYNAVADYVSNSEPIRKTDKSDSWRMWNFMAGYPMIETTQEILLAA